MANLMGLLLGTPAARLQSIARFWQLSDNNEPRVLISELYNEMTDDQAVKSIFERLVPREKLVLSHVLSEPKGWVALNDLFNALPFTMEETERLLSRLEDGGVLALELARVSGNEVVEWTTYPNRSRPATVMKVAFVPADLKRVFQRMQHQIASGDQSDRTIHKVLGALDLSQLQAVGARWHVPQADQCFKRELIASLEAAILEPDRVGRVLEELGPCCRSLYDLVRSRGGRMGLDEVRSASGLAEGDLRHGIAALSGLLILQETYVGGDRHLCIPLGVAPQEAVPVASKPARLTETARPGKCSLTDCTFFFDLLVLLDYFRHNEVRLEGNERRIPKQHVVRLREQLAFDPRDDRGTVRLHYLFHVARGLSLLHVSDGDLLPTEKAGRWPALGVVQQARAIFQFWQEDDGWRRPHTSYPDDWNAATYRTLRERIVAVVGECRSDSWYSAESIVQAIVGANTAGCRELVQIYWQPGLAIRDRQQMEACVVATVVTSLFHCIGAVALGYDEQLRPSAIKVTRLGAWLFGNGPAPEARNQDGRLLVQPNFEVSVVEPETDVWYQLLKFTITVSVARASVHQITKRKVQQAILSGLCVGELLGFLRQHSTTELPANVVSSIEEWARGLANP
ncbi:MAG: hypothetical protein HY675_13375 [Chloroflexi bacterium]|nr:hypothetical protein [Chloroflexota bacterium]